MLASITLTVTAVIATNVGAATPATPATPGAASAPGIAVITAATVDPEYVYSVADTESPAAVKHRAQQVLGDRFVELWISPDELSYVVGVHNLTSAEKAQVTALITGTAPVKVVNRPVSRAQLDDFAERLSEVTDTLRPTISSYALDYVAGAVLISTPESTFHEVVATIKDRTGVVALAEDDRTVMTADGVAASGHSEPQIVVSTREMFEE